MTRKMALINETNMEGSFANGKLARYQKFLRLSHPGLDDLLMGRMAGRLFEQPGEVIGSHVNRLSNPGNS